MHATVRPSPTRTLLLLRCEENFRPVNSLHHLIDVFHMQRLLSSNLAAKSFTSEQFRCIEVASDRLSETFGLLKAHINMFIRLKNKQQNSLKSKVPFRFVRHLFHRVANDLIAFLKLDIMIGKRQAAFYTFLHRLNVVTMVLQRRQRIYTQQIECARCKRSRSFSYLDEAPVRCEPI